jgi:biotin operon repressor
MPKIGSTIWTPDEEYRLTKAYSYYGNSRNKWELMAKEVGRPAESCRSHWRLHNNRLIKRLQASPYPKYDEPLTSEGDALIIPDPEFPFHNAGFINRILDLAQAWKIELCIIGGDLLHLDSLSKWEPQWEIPNGKGGLDEKQELAFIEFAKGLGKRQQEVAFALLDKIGSKEEDGDPNVSEELSISRKAIKSLAECFKKVDVILGNHDGRLLRQLNSPLYPTEITRLIERQDWRIAPYYFGYLISNGEKFIIEHPKSAAIITAEKLASKFQCHAIVCHSHMLQYTFDISGRFYAITTGCCADEYLFAYASQRHTNVKAHHLGATIVREGIPTLLHERVDWKRLEMMA